MPNLETNVFGAALGDDNVAFWEQLKAEIETPLDARTESDVARKAVLERLGIRKGAPTKADVYELDRLTLEIASDEEVIAQAPGLYRKYCHERGEPINPDDPALNPPQASDTEKLKALRARMLEILRVLHWSYTFGPIRERRRVRLIKEPMLVMVAATIIMVGLVAVLRSMNHLSLRCSLP
jgi:hypothetical protein